MRCTEWRPRHAAWQFGSHGGAAIGELNRHQMIEIFKVKWRGIAALIYWLCGLCVIMLFRSPHAPTNGFIITMLLGWVAPVLMLAFSGLHSGPLASRVCAAIVLVTFALLALRLLIPAIPEGH